MNVHVNRAMVAQVHWPVEEGEELEAYLLRVIALETLPPPTLSYASALDEAKQLLRDDAREPIIVLIS